MMNNIPSKMFGLKKSQDKAGLSFCDDLPIPKIGPRDVLVAVTHTGICGTDRHIYEWDEWSRNRVKLGTTIGHEFVGRIVRVGDAVRKASVGERVSAEGHITCGFCQLCRTGEGHICEKVDILGIDCNGCFAQYVRVPEDNIWHVHVDISDEIAAVFDPLGNAMHTVMSAGVSGKSVLITGVGIIGLMAVNIARACGATRILVSDIDPKRLALAKELGADEAYLATDSDWVKQARDATNHLGPEVLLEMSGNATAIRQGFKALRNGGRAALLGIPAREVPLDFANDIIFKGATIIGVNGRRMFETWYQVQELLLSGRLNLEPIITHQLPFSEFDSGFGLMQSGEGIKVVLEVPTANSSPCPTTLSKTEPTNS